MSKGKAWNNIFLNAPLSLYGKLICTSPCVHKAYPARITVWKKITIPHYNKTKQFICVLFRSTQYLRFFSKYCKFSSYLHFYLNLNSQLQKAAPFISHQYVKLSVFLHFLITWFLFIFFSTLVTTLLVQELLSSLWEIHISNSSVFLIVGCVNLKFKTK